MSDDIARLGYEIDSSQTRTAASDLDKLAAASAKAASGATSLASASKNMLRDETGRFMSAQAAADKYGDEIDQLRQKYIPMYAASKQLAAAQDEIRRALELGAISKSRAATALRELDAKYIATGNAVAVYGKKTQAAAHHSTNLLFQFQDIGMMLAAGQNPLMLAMQQGTQVAGVFHQMKASGQSAFSGIKAGLLGMVSPMSLMTIGVIAGGAALVQWGMSALGAEDDAKTLEERMDDLTSATDDLKKFNDLATKSYKELRGEFGASAEDARALFDVMRQISTLKAIDAQRDALKSVREEFEGISDALSFIDLAEESEGPSVVSRWAKDLKDDFGLTVDQAKTLRSAMMSVNTAISVTGRNDAVRDLFDIITSIKDETGMIPPQLVDLAQKIGLSVEQGYRLQAAISNVSTETASWDVRMQGVRVELNAIAAIIASLGGGAISAAAKRTEIEALRAGKSVKAAAVAASEFKENLEIDAQVAGLESRFGVIGKAVGVMVRGQSEYNRELDKTLDAEREAAIKREKDAAKAGGSKGGSESNDLDNFISSLMTERETLEVWRAEQLGLLAQYNDAELAAIGGKNEAKLRLEQEYSEKLVAIKKHESDMVKSAASGMYGELSNLLNTFGQKSKSAAIAALAVNTALRISEVIQNTAAASVRALAELGPVAGPPAAAKIKMYGMAQSALIAANAALSIGGSSGGGGSGGGGAPSGANASSSAQEPEKVVRISVQGEKWMRDLVEGLASQLYEASGDGSRVIVSR